MLDPLTPFLTAYWLALFALLALALVTWPKGRDLARVRVHTDTNHRKAF